MSWNVHISTSFAADYNEDTAEIAKNHIEQCEGKREIRWMLQAFADGDGFFEGAGSPLFNWGIIGKKTNGLEFARGLLPFLEDLRANPDSGFLDFEHALVFCEEEGSESPTAYEIKPMTGRVEDPLIIVEHLHLPFSWQQF